MSEKEDFIRRVESENLKQYIEGLDKKREEKQKLQEKINRIERVYMEGKGQVIYIFGGSYYYAFDIDSELMQKEQDEFIKTYLTKLKDKLKSIE